MTIATSRVTSKGQSTIPEKLRKSRGIKPGEQLVWIETPQGILVKKASELEDLFKPFEEIAKAEGLTRKDLMKEVEAAKRKTWQRLQKEK